MPVNRSDLIVLPEAMAEVIVTDPNTADIAVHGTTRFSVLGKKVGTTDIRVFNKDNKVIKEFTVNVSYDLPAIRKALGTFFPYERIGVEVVNEGVALTGTVTDAQVASKAVEIVNEFINPVSGSAMGSGSSSGAGGSTSMINPSAISKIINLLQVTSGQQVMLRVRIGELQRSSLKNLGARFSANKTAGNFSYLTDTGSASATTFGSLTAGLTTANWGLSASLDALEQNGVFRILAEPNLVATSGEKADFLAGGEFPIPIAQSNNTLSITFKQFGVAVQFTPFVLTANRIRLIVQPEVSELTSAGSVQIQGTSVPALTSRRARTTVELAPGESFMIAGLLSDKMNNSIDQLPGVGEIPVLSALFRSTNFQRNETELVMAVTPYIVDPVTSSEIRMPSDDYKMPSMMESVFYGALGAQSGDAIRISQTPGFEGPVGFMTE
ncbi:MAG: type II and III secretion system protein family protein [Alphaproteobacteria bacterium]|nr:type II and III secretion system protein family protein [Alphaproteobacteria bacterium]